MPGDGGRVVVRGGDEKDRREPDEDDVRHPHLRKNQYGSTARVTKLKIAQVRAVAGVCWSQTACAPGASPTKAIWVRMSKALPAARTAAIQASRPAVSLPGLRKSGALRWSSGARRRARRKRNARLTTPPMMPEK